MNDCVLCQYTRLEWQAHSRAMTADSPRQADNGRMDRMKTYRISLQRNWHDIELIKNVAYNRDLHDMYECALQALSILQDADNGHGIAIVTGKQYGIISGLITMAVEYRSNCKA